MAEFVTPAHQEKLYSKLNVKNVKTMEVYGEADIPCVGEIVSVDPGILAAQ